MKKKKTQRLVLLILIEILLTGILLVIFAFFHHVLPRLRVQFQTPAPTPMPAVTAAPTPVPTPEPIEVPEATPEPTPDPRTEWQIRFADHFSDEVIVTENSYVSPEVSVTVTEHTAELSAGKCVYYIADIYLASPDQFRACLAGDKFELYYCEFMEDCAPAHNALAAINGDFYSYQLSNEYAVTVREGVVYRAGPYSVSDICVMYKDGSVATYSRNEYNIDELLQKDPLHVWHFGPKLILEDGSPNTNYANMVGISYQNPRTALGYYEPGHYCFLVADGRNEHWSNGMRFSELADIMVGLGCKYAYNLDGGGSSVLYFNGEICNKQCVGRASGDILYILAESPSLHGIDALPAEENSGNEPSGEVQP